jgi:Na+/H+-dicarboxylate symporter
MKRGLGLFIALAMMGGIAAGYAANLYMEAGDLKTLTMILGLVTDGFLRLIKMIIAPLILSTLIAGIAHMEDAAAIGRIGAKTMFWFVSASIVSLTIGLVMVRWLEPGAGMHLAIPAAAHGAVAAVDTSTFTIKDFVNHLIPRSIVEAMANNEILQIVVFSCFVGTAVAALDDRAPMVTVLVEQIAAIMLKVTSFVMNLAPFAVFAALASTVASHGIGVLVTYAQFIGGFYLSLGILWLLLGMVAVLVMGRRSGDLLGAIRPPILLAFSTASSEAAYPKMLEGLQAIGLPRRIVSFVLPLGYSFNLDGSMMYCTFATLFIAQAYGITLSLPQQITMLFLLMITSKGMAGVPKASLVVIAATLAYFKLPEAGLLLILGVDQLLDMGRSATNVVGNSVACAVVSRWEGALGKDVVAEG